MARPKKYNIDTKEVVKLASYGCTNKEIADFFGCSADLLEKSYSEFLRKGKVAEKISQDNCNGHLLKVAMLQCKSFWETIC